MTAGQRDLAAGALDVLLERDLVVVRGPRRARHAALLGWSSLNRLDSYSPNIQQSHTPLTGAPIVHGAPAVLQTIMAINYSIRPRSPGGIVLAAAVLLLSLAPSHAAQTAGPLTVAFVGDQGSGYYPRAVLEVIKAQGADMMLHLGDFDYHNDPDAWDAMISDVLGPDFPVFAVVGNRDVRLWNGPRGYQAKLQARLARVVGAHCSGDIGVMSACTYRGLFFILSGAGTIPGKVPDEPHHVAYIKDQLARTDATWRVCSWHKNQADMQVGHKGNEVGWGPYEACLEGGAIVATGHDHSYARTHLMDSFKSQHVASTSKTLVVEKGKSFAVVSGLGGKSITDQNREGAWWASVYSTGQDADFGALFCTFNVNGDPTRAHCHFRDIRGRVPDRFEVISPVDGSGAIRESVAR